MLLETNNREWCVVYTMPKAETKVYGSMVKNEIKAFLPMYKKIVQWSDRKKKVLKPLFPNYIFVYLNRYDVHHVYSIPGFVRFITTKGQMDTVSQHEIDSIQQLLQLSPSVSNENFEVGEKVIVESGPLLGLTGILVEKRGTTRLVVCINSLSLNLVVEISPDQVRPLCTHSPIIL